MAKAERKAALHKRRQAIAIIKNVRRTRRVLNANAFDSATFNALNGKDCGLEALVGHTVMFDSLDESERLALRREINAKLFESEQQAFGALREASIEYFAELQKIIDRVTDVGITDKTITHLSSTKSDAVAAFENFQLEEGALDCERCVSMLENLAVIAEAMDESVPEIEHDLEEDEYTEEEHTHDDTELPEDGDDESVEEEDSDDDEEDDDEEEEEETSEGDEDDEDGEGTEIITVTTGWLETAEAFRESASKFTLPVAATTKEAGFDQKRATEIIAMYPSVMTKYAQALQHLRDAVAADTCTAESLLRGSKKFYARVDKVVSYVECFEVLRTALLKSCSGLVKAAHEMMLVSTRDPML